MNALRPIGTEFDYTFPPVSDSTGEAYSRTVRYRVVAHRRVLQWDGSTALAEEVEIVSDVPCDDNDAREVLS